MHPKDKTPAQIELTKSVLTHVDGLIQWTFLLNGAAAAGLLSFLGNAIDRQKAFPHWDSFSSAIAWFIAGIMLAIGSRLLTFISLNFMSQIDEPSPESRIEDLEINLKVGDRSVICAIIALALFLGACVCFVVGVLFGRHAIFS